MGVVRDVNEVHIGSQLHVLGVNAQNLETACLIGDTDVDFTIKAASASEGWVDRVGSVGGANDDDLAATFDTVHQSQKLGDNTLLRFALGLLSVGSD